MRAIVVTNQKAVLFEQDLEYFVGLEPGRMFLIIYPSF